MDNLLEPEIETFPSSRDPLIRGMAVNPDRIPDFWLPGHLENPASTMNI